MAHQLPLIELKGIIFGYPNSPPILHGVDLSVRSGDRLILVGGNGAGKTTLFHLILGLLQPWSGEIQLFGKRCSREKDFKEPRQSIGLLFQDPDDQLFSPSVLEDVAFGPLNQGLSHRRAEERSRLTLEALGISHLASRVPYHLSGGEKRLCALATILAMRPRVLLLDEPTVGLEDQAVERLLGCISSMGIEALVIISHRPQVLAPVTNGLLRLEQGRLTQMGC